MSNSEAILCPVLQSFFPDSVTLREYILNQIQDHHVQVPEEFLTNVGSSLQSLLDTAMVASIPFTRTDANSTRSKKNRTTSNVPHVVDNTFTNTIYPLSISQEQVNSSENFNWQICLTFFFTRRLCTVDTRVDPGTSITKSQANTLSYPSFI